MLVDNKRGNRGGTTLGAGANSMISTVVNYHLILKVK